MCMHVASEQLALLLSPRNTSHLHTFTFFTWRLSHHPGSISDDARLEHDHWRCSLGGLDQRWQRCSLGRNLSFDHWRCSLGGLDQRRCTGPDRWRCSNLGSISELLAVTVPRWQTSNFADHIIEWLHVVDCLVCLLALLRWLHSAAWLSKVGKWRLGQLCFQYSSYFIYLRVNAKMRAPVPLLSDEGTHVFIPQTAQPNKLNVHSCVTSARSLR